MGTGLTDIEEADVPIESSTGNHDKLIDDDSNPVTDNFFTLQQDSRGINRSLFQREVERARDQFIDNREVCLLD